MKIEKRHSTVNLVHQQAAKQAFTRREAAIEANNPKSRVRKVNVEAKAYVLRGKVARVH